MADAKFDGMHCISHPGVKGLCGVVDATGFSLVREDSGGGFSVVYSKLTISWYTHTQYIYICTIHTGTAVGPGSGSAAPRVSSFRPGSSTLLH